MTDNWERGAHAALVLARSRAQSIRCTYCNAQVGEPCVSRSGAELGRLPAHTVRLQDAQAAP